MPCLKSRQTKLAGYSFHNLAIFANFDDGSFEKLCDHQIGYKFKAVMNLDSSTKSHHRFLHVVCLMLLCGGQLQIAFKLHFFVGVWLAANIASTTHTEQKEIAKDMDLEVH